MSGKEAVSTASTASTASLQLSLTGATLDDNGKPTPEAWVGSVHLGLSSARHACTLDTQTYAKATDGTLKERAMTMLRPVAKIVPTSGLLLRSSGSGSSYRVG